MSLEAFRRSRMVVLGPHASAYEAARAMADNGIGAVLVAEDRHIVGIVTDRDLALEMVGSDSSPRETQLRDVMTEDVASVDVGASLAEVVQTMRVRGCRRVPVTEHGRTVGMVSLDDLLLERALDLDAAAAIVRQQLSAASGSFKAEGATHPEAPARADRGELASGRAARTLMRRRARAELAYSRLLHSVENRTGLTSRPQTEYALLLVLGALCLRVTPDQASHLIAQLPSKLQGELQRVRQGPDRRITREAIEAELAREMQLDGKDAGRIVSGVGSALAESVSPGEIDALRGQLPMELKDLFPPRATFEPPHPSP